MTDVAHLELKVTSKGAEEATRKLSSLERAGGAVESRMKHVKGAIAGAFAGAAIAGATIATFRAVIQETVNFQNEQAQLAARLKSTGGIAGHTMDSLNDMATAMRSTTAVTGDQISKAQDLLLTFTNVRGAIYDQAIPAILDMSVALRQEAGQSALLLGKALNDPIKGITALTRSGIQFSASQKAVIKDLVETGDVAGAQAIILKELSVQFGGAAAAARDTLGGSLTNLKETFLELLEGNSGSDGVRGTRDAIESLAAQLRDPETRAAFANLAEGVFDVTAAFADGITKMAEWKNAYTKFLADRGLIEADENSTPEQLQVRRDKLTGMRDTIHSGKGVWGNDTVAKINQQVSKIDGLQGKEQPGAQYLPEYLGGKPTWSAIGHKGVMAPVGPKWNNAQTGELAGEDDDGPSKKAAKAAAKAAEERAKDLESLRASLMTEEEAIRASYQERETIISASGLKGNALETDLRARSKAERDAELAELKARQNAELLAIQDSLLTQEASVEASYQRRKEIVLKSMADGTSRDALIAKLTTERNIELAELAVTEQSKRDQLLGFAMTEQERISQERSLHLEDLRIFYMDKLGQEEQYQRDKAAIEARYAQQSEDEARDEAIRKMQVVGGMFGAMAGYAEVYAKGNSKGAERAFKVAKALNMAQAIMSIASGVAKAQELGPPLSYVQMAAVAAIGATQIATISSQKFSGAYDGGGRIPAGQVGIVGEKGMELVQGPANVTSRKDTARMLKADRAGGGNTITNNVTIQVAVDANGNVTGQTTEARSAGAGDTEQAKQLGKLIDLRVRDVLIREQRQGGMLSGGG